MSEQFIVSKKYFLEKLYSDSKLCEIIVLGAYMKGIEFVFIGDYEDKHKDFISSGFGFVRIFRTLGEFNTFYGRG
jgi:hypothetical protein